MTFDDQQQAETAIEGHLAAAKDDLRHVNELFIDAVSNLLTNAHAMGNACLMQQQELLRDDDPYPHQKEKLLALNREIDVQCNDLIVNLQFQDMATQLLTRVMAAIDSLEVFSELAAAGAGEEQHFQRTQMSLDPSLTLKSGSGRNADLCCLAQGARAKPVQSRDMRSGEVELF